MRTDNTNEMFIPEMVSTEGNLRDSMQASMYMGLVKPPENSSVAVETFCSTGNCTFKADDTGAVFKTLSICHSCRDISYSIIADNSSQHSLPSGAVTTADVLLSCATELDFGPSKPLFNLECIMRNEYALGNFTPFAIGCTLNPCVKTYSVSFRNSQYKETVLSTEILQPGKEVYHDDKPPIIKFATVIDPLQDGTRKKCKPSDTRTSTHTLVLADSQAIADSRYNSSALPQPQQWYEPECIWGVSEKTHVGFHSFLSEKIAEPKIGLLLSDAEPWFRRAFDNGNGSVVTFDTMFTGLTLAMSAQMRSENVSAGFFTPPATGVAWENDTCIGVRWQWISFPASLMLLEIMLLLATIERGRRSEWGGDWKSSSLPLLFNAPLNDRDMGAAKSLRVADMEERASLLKFKLARDLQESQSGGWRLHKVAELPPREKKSRKDKKMSKEAQEPSTTVEQREPSEDQRQGPDGTRQNTMPNGHEWV